MKISTALDKIDHNQLFVPAFQREYVWKRDDAKQLIDSLIKEYPTGTMLTWETNTPPELKGPHRYDERQGAVRILLDGQQRMTTLYMLIRGNLPPYYRAEEIVNDTRGLYVQLETMDLAYHTTSMDNEPRWQNITAIFQRKLRPLDIVKMLEAKGETVTRDLEYKISDNIRLIENILDRDFPEQTIPVRATLREAIDIFYKVNASGVALTDAELALAQISGYWPEARDTFKKKLTALAAKGYVFKLDFVVYVLLGCLYQLGSDMRKLHDSENNEKIRAAWQILDTRVLDYVASVMRSHAYVDHTDEINSVYALVPIIVYCYRSKTPHLSDAEIRKMVKWFYYSQIRYRYAGQLPQKLDKDLRVIRDSPNPFDDMLTIIAEERRLEIAPEEFVGAFVQNPLFGLMRWYFKSQNAMCFTTGVALRQAMGESYTLERDHIFPSSKLKERGYSTQNRLKYALAQEITNRAFLTKVANRSKNNKNAKDYLAEVAERFPNALALQCVPEDRDLWEIDRFEDFLQARRIDLAKRLNSFLEAITETSPTQAPLSVDDLIAEGESDELEFKSSLRWDLKEQTVNRKLEDVVMKTVAAFTNGQGGILLIGVNDAGEPLGLEGDYHGLGGANRDKFELHLRNLLNEAFGPAFVTSKVKLSFPAVNDIEICQVEVQPNSRPVVIAVKDKNGAAVERFYVRSGNTSQELSLSEMQAYVSERFST